jgi:hypothetical protein
MFGSDDDNVDVQYEFTDADCYRGLEFVSGEAWWLKVKLPRVTIGTLQMPDIDRAIVPNEPT